MTFTMRRAVVVLAVALGAVVPVTAAHAQQICTTPQVTVADTEAYEGDGQGVVGFKLTVPTGCPSPGTVTYRTVAGTASPGTDYVHTQGTWQLGTAATVHIPLLGDTQGEEDEEFSLHVFNERGVQLAQGTARLLDDDGKVTEVLLISVVDGGKICWVPDSCAIPISFSTPARAPFTLRYRTYDLTAFAGQDYVAVKDVRLVVPKGATGIEAPVATLPDDVPEPDEAFEVEVFAATAGRIDHPLEKITLSSRR